MSARRARPQNPDDPDAPFGAGTAFEAVGDFVRENYMRFPYTRGADKEAEFTQSVLGLPEGARILDVACGMGRHARHLAKHYRVTGLDLSRGLLEVGRTRAPAADFVRADARHVPFRNAFDGAISYCEGAFGLLGSDAEHERMLASVRAALKPGGKFLLSAMSVFGMSHDEDFDPLTNVMITRQTVKNPSGRARTFDVATRAFTPREVLAMARRAGLRPLAVYGGITGAYEKRPLTVEDAEMLVLMERPA